MLGLLRGDAEKAKEAIVQAAIMTGEIRIIKGWINVAVAAKSRREGREDVTKEEVLADLINEMLMSGEVNGIELCELIDKQHKEAILNK